MRKAVAEWYMSKIFYTCPPEYDAICYCCKRAPVKVPANQTAVACDNCYKMLSCPSPAYFMYLLNLVRHETRKLAMRLDEMVNEPY